MLFLVSSVLLDTGYTHGGRHTRTICSLTCRREMYTDLTPTT
jgi:hypothetical protein